ncbi:MAG TPA: hypothetical protein ENN69_08250 [Spirochaetia bacterium]|nr:hypothetical protein [Spirochaetia bacterium]
MRITRSIYQGRGLAALLILTFLAVACESKACRDLPEENDPSRPALENRCVFGIDLYGEPVQQIELLFPVCDFYVNTEPSVSVQTYFEGTILDRKFNARLAERVLLVRVTDAAMEQKDGWLRAKSVAVLAEIYDAKEENAVEAGVTAHLEINPISGTNYSFQIVFKNRSDEFRHLYFKPLNPGTPFAPPVEVREMTEALPVPVRVDLNASSLGDRGVLSGQRLYKKMASQESWRLFFRVTLLDAGATDEEYTAVLNYLVRKDLGSGTYWSCASPVVIF